MPIPCSNLHPYVCHDRDYSDIVCDLPINHDGPHQDHKFDHLGEILEWETQVTDEDEYVARCVVCNEPIDYCQGHGEIGDPHGHWIMEQHDLDIHINCHPESECFQLWAKEGEAIVHSD